MSPPCFESLGTVIFFNIRIKKEGFNREALINELGLEMEPGFEVTKDVSFEGVGYKDDKTESSAEDKMELV